MKKITVIHVLYSFDTGGLEKGIAMVVNHGSADFEHLIVCLTESGRSAELLPPGTRVIELHKPAGNSISFLNKLSKLLRSFDPDTIVHTRNWSGMDGIMAARLAGIKKIVHGEHGWGMEDARGTSLKRIMVRRLLSLGVMELTCVSKQMKSWLENHVKVPRPVTQVYNGIDISRFSPEGKRASLRQDLGLSDAAKIIACVGRLDPIKNHVGLIQSFIQVRQAFPETALLIVGDGPERAKLEAMNAPHVYLLGARYDIPDILRAVDIFALASINEGISNTILEAMAAGLPVVSTDVGGTPELIAHGNNGFLCVPENNKEFSHNLITYLQSENLRIEHGRCNRRITEERFSIKAMVEGYEQVWARIAAH